MKELTEIGNGIVYILFFTAIGIMWSYLRYRNKEERSKVLHEEYDGAYYRMGKDFFYRAFMVTFLLTLLVLTVGLMGATIYATIRSWLIN